ncbi:MAG: LysM peptidoglycan-binding domain-containing protein [Clostridia bacterium]|nr:LysM peptidoglycan-binding domain-containing protein [Clostridia bacterium]
MKKKYILKNKKRFLIAIFLVLSVIISTTLLVTKRPEGKGDIEFEQVVIHHGDTLWDIAVEKTDGTMDIRKVVYEIKKFNNLETADLYVGQVVKIPSF